MDWQAADDWQGGMPGRDADLPALLAAFGRGGVLETAAPSAALAMALERAGGPGGKYGDADADALVGIARQWTAIESWATANLLAALRAMMREDDTGSPVLRRRTDMPGGWDDSLNYEIAAALAMGPVSAQHLAGLAWTLGMRLPGIGRLLADGTLTRSKARLVAQLFEPLDEDEAARAEALILGDLDGKTYPQVERLAWRAALAVAPDVAERHRSGAERQARVRVFREEAGTAGLSGRDLPAAEALAGHANLVARARAYELSGVFPGETPSRLQAQAYLDLLNGVPAADRIAFAATANADPPDDPSPDDDGNAGPPDDPGPNDGNAGPPGDPGPDDGNAGPPDDPGPNDGNAGPPDHDRGDEDWPGGNDDDGPGPCPGNIGSRPVPVDGNEPDRAAGDDDMPEPDDHSDIPQRADNDGCDGHDADPSGDGGGGPGEPEAPAAPPAALAEVTVPLATLQHQAERAGDSRLLGPLDPDLARQLAAAAARSPHSRWEIIVTDEHGYATGHGTARTAAGTKPPPRPPGTALTALPARVSITVTEAFLRQLSQRGQQAQQAQPRSGAPPSAWQLIQKKPGSWALTLPGGRPLTVRFDVVPTHTCDHRYQTASYVPGERLRRLVQVRDHQCTFPTCSRPASESDFEHAVPYDKGGKTDACNAGARSRRCHQVKQSQGWTVTQPKPGWHQWTTPTGRTYTQEPWSYTA